MNRAPNGVHVKRSWTSKNPAELPTTPVGSIAVSTPASSASQRRSRKLYVPPRLTAVSLGDPVGMPACHPYPPLKVNSFRSRDWPYARNGRKQERSAIRRTSRYGSTPKSESLRILKRAGRAECWEHRERSRGKRGTYDSAMPLSFPAIEQLRYLWGGPPGLRPTPRRPVAGVKELDPSSGERVQGDPPRPGPDQGSAP